MPSITVDFTAQVQAALDATATPPVVGVGAFPTTPILDTGSRLNENPLSDGGKWTWPIIDSETPGAQLEIVSNVISCVSTGFGGYGEAYRNDSFSTDCEVYCDLHNGGGSQFELHFRLTPGAIETGYAAIFDPGGTFATDITIYRIEPDGFGWYTFTLLTTIAAVIIDFNDSIGIRMVGDTITAYLKPFGGAWAAVGTVTDATYPSGYIGIYQHSTTFAHTHGFVNFGGNGAAAPGQGGYTTELLTPSIVPYGGPDYLLLPPGSDPNVTGPPPNHITAELDYDGVADAFGGFLIDFEDGALWYQQHPYNWFPHSPQPPNYFGYGIPPYAIAGANGVVELVDTYDPVTHVVRTKVGSLLEPNVGPYTFSYRLPQSLFFQSQIPVGGITNWRSFKLIYTWTPWSIAIGSAASGIARRPRPVI